MTETTVNIRADYLERVRKVSKTCNVPLCRIVEKLLQKMVAAVRYNGRIGAPALYQERCGERAWFCFHLYIPEPLFEQCLDLRKLSKRSLSRLFAEGINAYLSDVMAELMGGEGSGFDNNRYFYRIRFCNKSDSYYYSAFAIRRGDKGVKSKLQKPK